ncbi:MAG: ATP cone domain-containing protein [Opitutales bacterium]|nr:ATP cone domain-containing protein [Opitutales bacterium]
MKTSSDQPTVLPMNTNQSFLFDFDPSSDNAADTAVVSGTADPSPELVASQLFVKKRDGNIVPWNLERVVRAVCLAFFSVYHKRAVNPNRDNPAAFYGLDERTFKKAEGIAEMVERVVRHRMSEDSTDVYSIEKIQDIVETCIVGQGEWQVARHYMLYREERSMHRPRQYPDNGLREYIAVSKYARYRSQLGRREVWGEAVHRVRDMHLRRYAQLATAKLDRADIARIAQEENVEASVFNPESRLFEEIWKAFDMVENYHVLPSMRSLQFGGKAIEANEARLYNCSFSYANRIEFFRETFFLLLSGVGVGFSVQKHHIAQLPAFPFRKEEMDLEVRHYEIEDSVEGWSDAVDTLFRSYLEGWLVEFSFAKIRHRGAPIMTAGGKAPGHLPLKRSLQELDRILKGCSGRRLRPVEVYDIVMFIAQAVLSGGIRRSATLCLFSSDDEEMANAKTGRWFETNPQRAYSNNSAILVRSETDKETFMHLYERIREFGEPGFYFTEDKDYGANPCVEIGLHPRIVVDQEAIADLRALGYNGALNEGDELSGWQMCNLSTINGASITGEADFYEKCRYASVIGTLQAGFTSIPYLGPVTEYLNQREALLGVSICGILDNPKLLLNPEILEKGARMVRATNALFASVLGIRKAARTTCVKPEGTASLLLNTGSGIHPHHARRYFRRVQASRQDPVYRLFKEKNAHMSEPSVYNPSTDDVITFPVEAPEGAICQEDVTAIHFLEYVKLVQRHWVEAGQSVDQYSPRLHHNVSNTVSVAEGEWSKVAEFIWENRDYFAGIALLHKSGDKVYKQAPRESLVGDEDYVRWNSLEYHPVDYRNLREGTDETKLAENLACAGGACELI